MRSSGDWLAAVIDVIIVAAMFMPAAGTARGQGERPTAPPATRPFNSKLQLDVWAQPAEDRGIHLGQTPSPQPLEIPPCVTWWVSPVGNTSVAAAAREMQDQSIPGLALRRATDADMVYLKDLKGLQYLDLHNSQVTDAGLEQLMDLKGLQFLDLGRAAVTDLGLEHLKVLKHLQSLDLTGTKVTDAGLAHLKSMRYLDLLDLEGTGVTDAGVEALEANLPDCHIVH